MKIADGAGLWKALQKEGLTEKRVGEMSMSEIELMASVFADYADGDVPPYWDGANLIVPFAAPYRLRWWMHRRTPEERIRQLREAGVPEDRLTMYVCQREIDMAEGRVDESGNPAAPEHGRE